MPPFRSITKWAELFTQQSAFLRYLRVPSPCLRWVGGVLCCSQCRVMLQRKSFQISAFSFRKVERVRTAADPARIEAAIAMIRSAENPILFIGQGVLWAQATQELIVFAENAAIPVMTTILGKSAFPESHALALGAAGPAVTGMVEHFLNKADLVIAIGAGLTRTLASREIPKGKKIIQVSLDEEDINAEYHVDLPILGDAQIVIAQLMEEYARHSNSRQEAAKALAHEIAEVKRKWLESWMPKLTSSEIPINPYRVC